MTVTDHMLDYWPHSAYIYLNKLIFIVETVNSGNYLDDDDEYNRFGLFLLNERNRLIITRLQD